MDAATIVELETVDPELAAQVGEQVERDREAAALRRFGILGFEAYVKLVANPDAAEIALFE